MYGYHDVRDQMARRCNDRHAPLPELEMDVVVEERAGSVSDQRRQEDQRDDYECEVVVCLQLS